MHLRVMILILLASMLLLFSTGCGNDPLSPSVTVRYQVTGTASTVNIDYLDQGGNLAILNNEQVPWETTFTRDQGEQVYLSAKRTGDTGSVTVKIFSNGTVVGEETSADGSIAEIEVTL